MKVYIVTGEHPTTPGVIIRVHSTREKATASAVELTQIILDDTIEAYPHWGLQCPSDHWNNSEDICRDCGADLQAEAEEKLSRHADASNWETVMTHLESVHGAAHCYVSLDEHQVDPTQDGGVT